MLAVATLLGRGMPYKNVISLGHVLDAKGEKMSKSKGNIVSHDEMIEKYGVDALRWYFFTVNGPGEPKRFEEKDVALRARGFVATLWNSFVFWDTYVAKNPKLKAQNPGSKNILDKWILTVLNQLILQVGEDMDAYDLVGAARAIDEFTINDFSQWYIQCSRRRLQHPRDEREGHEAAAVMARVLLTLAELSAPFAPFAAEAVYQGLRKKMGLREESVHLRTWPARSSRMEDGWLLDHMRLARGMVAQALKLRAEAGIKVRQPLASFSAPGIEEEFEKPIEDVIKDRINVKKIVWRKDIHLDTVLTPELKMEGVAREVIRNIQEMRRELGLTPSRTVAIAVGGGAVADDLMRQWGAVIARDTHSRVVASGGIRAEPRLERALRIDDAEIRMALV
jgi:isoleucyl-tRNA synthetase